MSSSKGKQGREGGAFSVTFLVLNKNNTTGDMLCKDWYTLGDKKIKASLTKHDLGTSSVGVLFNISNEHAHPFHMGDPPPPNCQAAQLLIPL